MSNEFYCWSCNKHKPIEQLGKKKPTGRHICKSCVEQISERVRKAKENRVQA